ncbi:hypothetical protein C8R45DRAFT_1097447 [Mycena sanguinolenta]|nr:hypothetical protein C8R45DRAFT_1097447 [Mycena sanguinolenta]
MLSHLQPLCFPRLAVPRRRLRPAAADTASTLPPRRRSRLASLFPPDSDASTHRTVDIAPPRLFAARMHTHVFTYAHTMRDEAASRGFVWNQDLFVPPYIKDRCASPSSLPPFILVVRST